MLMLGECVLTSVTLSPPHATLQFSKFNYAAAATFVISIALMWMGYSVSVFSGNRHVLRRSALGGIFWSMCIPYSSFALISVGVGLRMLMKTGSAAATSKETLLLSGAIVAFFLFSVIVDYLHNPQAYRRGRLLMQLVLGTFQYSLHMFASTLELSGWDMVIATSLVVVSWTATCIFVNPNPNPNLEEMSKRFHGHDEDHDHAD